MNKYKFKYGDGAVELDLTGANVIGELYGTPTPALEDLQAAVWASLEHPVESAPLRELVGAGDKITLVISDMSRFWMRQDLILPHVVAYLNDCGIKDEDIVFLVATGTHIGGPEAELRTLVSDAMYDRIAVVNHDCLAEDLVYVGTTSRGTEVLLHPLAADKGRKVITMGAVTHHVMAGYGGGRKSILPGVAAKKSINQNHLHALDPNAAQSNPLIGNSVLEGNPLNEDMCEAAALIAPIFTINLMMNADGKHCGIIGGHWYHSWRTSCDYINSVYETPIPKRADVVITGCGGYPKDMSMYQGTKTIDNTETGVKPGGTLVMIAECRDGGGPAEYFDWVKPLQEGRLDEALRAGFSIPGYVFYLNCEQARRMRIVLLSDINPDDVAPMGIEAYRTPEELLAHVDIQGKEVYVIPNGGAVIPRVK